MLGCTVGVPFQSRFYHSGLFGVLFLLRRVLRFNDGISADMQTVYRRADTFPILPVLELAVCRMASLSALAQEDRSFTVTSLRGAQLRVYQRTTYRVHYLREYGKEKDDGYHGHGSLARGHVPSKGVGDIAAKRHEIPVLSVDMLREGIAKVYGIRHGV